MGDGDEAEIDEEGEDIEHEQPLEKAEVGQDRGAEPPPDLLQTVLPDHQALPGRGHAHPEPTEELRNERMRLKQIETSLHDHQWV